MDKILIIKICANCKKQIEDTHRIKECPHCKISFACEICKCPDYDFHYAECSEANLSSL